MEKDIVIENGIGIKEQRQLWELKEINKALNKEEFFEIVAVYDKCINRLLDQSEKKHR